MRVALNGLFLALPGTGTGQYLRELVRALRVQAPEDEFVLVAPQADSSAPAPIQSNPPRVRHPDLAKLEFEQLTFPRASSVGFDLAHVPHFGSPLFPTCPTVVTIHDLIPMVLPTYHGSWRVRLYTQLAARSARRARAILADSKASAREIESLLNIPRPMIHVVYLAADARFHPPSPQEIQRVRVKYNLPEQFVLYLGGFDVRKNVERAIEAFRDGRPNTEDWRLVIAGRMPERDNAFFPDPRKIAEKLGVTDGVQYVGFVSEEDKPALYGAARVFLFPSRYEGFGLPPLEAMACGTPVISANASSLPEVVGDGGILLDADDTRGWSDELDGLLRDKARWSGLQAGALEQAKKFSWEQTALKTLEVYRLVV